MSLRDLLGKKGVFDILNQLKIGGSNYNSIKRRVLSKISSRTLDSRLKDLLEIGVIDLKLTQESEQSKYLYHLTPKGIFILSMFEQLKEIMNGEFDEKKILEDLSAKLKQNRRDNFEQAWAILKGILREKKVIYTLKRKKANNIINVDDSGIEVQTEKGFDKIGIDLIKHAWINLVNEGELARDEHEKSTYRSSFILALFSELPWIKIKKAKKLVIYLSHN